jgi:hypothetical protein
MKISNPNHQKIVRQVGLNFTDYDLNFKKYIPQAYPNSETEAMDEIYRMYEHALLHKESGLRVSYLTSESYYGDSVEYTIIDCFVITFQNQKYSVTGIDLEKRIFDTPSGTLPFSAVRNTLDKSD